MLEGGNALEPLSILILSTPLFCDRLKLALMNLVEKDYPGVVKIKCAESGEDIITSRESSTLIDYVVIVLDSTQPAFPRNFQNDMKCLEPHMISTRLLVVNGANYSCSLANAKMMCNLADEFSIPLVNGEVMNNASCKILCQRILKLAFAATGFWTGLPFVIPTPKDVGL